MARDFDLAGQIIGCAMKVHRTLGPGFLESVYQKALAIELRKAGFYFEEQKSIQVHYDDQVIGEFVADMLVEKELIVEIKAVSALVRAHAVQLVNYLTATGKDIGVLLNFGAQSLEYHKKFRRPLSAESRSEIIL
ncbi:MAG: GxxExxY protein [Verrucomicrobia bacterium]|nr:GxxExxY protein [Verrucomicrobiota bacterium]